jgi:hypothetical protein
VTLRLIVAYVLMGLVVAVLAAAYLYVTREWRAYHRCERAYRRAQRVRRKTLTGSE